MRRDMSAAQTERAEMAATILGSHDVIACGLTSPNNPVLTREQSFPAFANLNISQQVLAGREGGAP